MAPPRLIAKSAHDEATVLDGEVPTSLLVDSTSFLANGHPILKEVPAHITATPWSPSSYLASEETQLGTAVGLFVGFHTTESKGRRVVWCPLASSVA
ncbi:hypothetical protein SLE2022_293330 [Rubroshorea leprosula]